MVGETMTDRWGNPDNLQVVSIQISRSGILHWFHTDIYQDMSYSTSQNKIYTEHFEILTSCSSFSSSLWHCYSPAWDRRCWRNSDGLFHYKVWRGGKVQTEHFNKVSCIHLNLLSNYSNIQMCTPHWLKRSVLNIGLIDSQSIISSSIIKKKTYSYVIHMYKRVVVITQIKL